MLYYDLIYQELKNYSQRKIQENTSKGKSFKNGTFNDDLSHMFPLPQSTVENCLLFHN